LKSAITALSVTLLMSPDPSAAVGSRVVSDGLGLGELLGEDVGLADGDGLLDALAWPVPPRARAPAA
jgi:hypothetical protein